MDRKKIGMKIAYARKKKNLTRQELADTLNITTRTVMNWEKGKCLPDYSVLIPLCDVLDISIDELLDNENNEDVVQLILNYLDRNRQINLKEKQFVGKILLIGGIFIVLFILFIFPPYHMISFDTNRFIYVGIILSLLGFTLINNKYRFNKRIFLNVLLFCLFFIILNGYDILNIILNNYPPRFYTAGITDSTSCAYNTLFYDVYRCFNQDDKYHIISKKDGFDYTRESIIMDPSYYYCNEEE